MTDKKRKSGTDLVRSLHNLVCGDDTDNVEKMPMDEVYSYLKKNNIAHDQVIAGVQEQLNKMMAKALLDEAKVKRETLNKLSDVPLPANLKGSIKGLIDQIMTQNPRLASAYFRKYESATENDLESLYQDLMALQKIDKDDTKK